MPTKLGMTANLLFSLTVFTLLMTTSSQNAVALPANEVTTTYYTTASKTQEVGESTLLCNGQRSMEGRKTSFSSRSSSPCNPSSPPLNGSGLPCEFLAQGCSNLPGKR